MSEEINIDKYVARARSFGFNVFYGSPRVSITPEVYWDDEQGDYVKFLKLAKDSGATLIIVDHFIMGNSNIDEEKLNEEYYEGDKVLEKVKNYNQQLESFRQYVGKVGSVSLSWFMNGVLYTYTEFASWADSFFELASKIDEEYGER
ncbi:MAG: hypothetical protein JRN26_02230 [Nitrososphaerota archaeon]|nr:hypothetical protein [Nitrososphaerota archaeon]